MEKHLVIIITKNEWFVKRFLKKAKNSKSIKILKKCLLSMKKSI